MMNKHSAEREQLNGIGVSPGIACGKAFLHISGFPEYKEEVITEKSIPLEIEKVKRAFEQTSHDMEQIKAQAAESENIDLTGVLDAQILIVADPEFKNQVIDKIESLHYSAIFAFTSSVNDNIELLSRSKDPYMREMIADIETVSNHILKHLLGERHKELTGFVEPAILFASYFNPGEILEMPNLNVSGFVTERGGPTSHMGLFAKSLGIPAVVAVKANLKQIPSGSKIIIDGSKGTVIINPGDEEWEEYQKISHERREARFKRFQKIHELPSATRDSHHVDIMANLDLPTSLDEILAHEGVGIGLYRTEFLYLKRANFPSEDDQTKVYYDIAKKFAPQNVILRTFDLGGDKLTDYFKSEFEINPALGWRAIRFSLDVAPIFEVQLRAMLKASTLKNVSIMLPLITTLDEVQKSKEILERIKNDLRQEKAPFDENIKFGIMIETPAAVFIADALAREVDFFSIGTNDLTQYTLAVDRNNKRVAKHFQALHPAVLHSIKKTVESAHKAGKTVGICGEIAGDPLATKLLVGLGVDSLSMNPASIPVVKGVLPKIDFEEALKFAERVLSMASEKEITEILIKDFKESNLNNSANKKGELRNA
ncbi:MAG TPA: phosphoenolpyruvate--protein phosphotransferase [candidate division Zixibacteria bacterium]|nr:phosphoenolpyruvate--protein phosphotransferase [candidate division Zixibacteria bacterium]HEQ99435.1 phosphoenolpyruvate--protein phosphotransferase [candidate division Zixibacteria bacterium]